MNAWDRTWYAPVAGVRPWLFRRGLFALLAFDCWLVDLPHGGKYGAGGFNVAHFGWLEAIQPTPSPPLYVGLMLLTGLLALVAALGPRSRAIEALVLVGWTWGWAMSRLDSYQHHYFLSVMLACALAGPTGEPRAAEVQEGAWAWRLGGVTVGIVYAFATVAKLDPGWLDGTALRRATGPTLRPVADLLAAVGEVEPWPLLAATVVSAEALIALAYLLSPWRDRVPRVAALAFVAMGLVAIALHAHIHFSGFKIGWFSAYMALCSVAWLLPARWIEVGLGWLSSLPRLPRLGPDPLLPLLAAMLVIGAGATVDLPGTPVAGIVAGLILAISAWRVPARAAAALASGLAMWLAITQTTVRFDFYRYLGWSSSWSGDLPGAIDAYESAGHYAPAGEERDDRVQALRQRLAAGEAAGNLNTGDDDGEEPE